MIPSLDPKVEPMFFANEKSEETAEALSLGIEGRFHPGGLVARETLFFRVELPERAWMTFRPGQHAYLEWPAPPFTDEKGDGRNFAIASPPSELPILSFASRKTGSAFKRCLETLPDGTPIRVAGPFGTFTLPEDWPKRTWEEPVVFVAWGIGITPFRSMLLDALPRNASVSFFLFASDRSLESAPFRAEIDRLAADHKNLTLVRVVSQPSRLSSSGPDVRVGALTPNVLFELLGIHAERADYFIAGPPSLVDSFRKALLLEKIAPEQVRTASFTGYPEPKDILQSLKGSERSARLAVLFDELFPHPGFPDSRTGH